MVVLQLSCGKATSEVPALATPVPATTLMVVSIDATNSSLPMSFIAIPPSRRSPGSARFRPQYMAATQVRGPILRCCSAQRNAIPSETRAYASIREDGKVQCPDG